MHLNKERIKIGLEKAYKENGRNAFVANGFEAGINFALSEVKNINRMIELKQKNSSSFLLSDEIKELATLNKLYGNG